MYALHNYTDMITLLLEHCYKNCRADTRISLKCCFECHEGWLYSFLTSVFDRGQQSASHPGHFTSGDDPWELLVRGMCRPGSQPGNFEEETNVLSQPGIKLEFCGCTAQQCHYTDWAS